MRGVLRSVRRERSGAQTDAVNVGFDRGGAATPELIEPYRDQGDDDDRHAEPYPLFSHCAVHVWLPVNSPVAER